MVAWRAPCTQGIAPVTLSSNVQGWLRCIPDTMQQTGMSSMPIQPRRTKDASNHFDELKFSVIVSKQLRNPLLIQDFHFSNALKSMRGQLQQSKT